MQSLERRTFLRSGALAWRRPPPLGPLRGHQAQHRRERGAGGGRRAELLRAGRHAAGGQGRRGGAGHQQAGQGAFQNVVVTQDWHTPGHASFASSLPGKKPFETTKLKYGTQVLWPDHCVQGTADADLHKDLKLPHRAAHHPQGLQQGHGQLLGLRGGRPQERHRPGRLPEARGIKTVYITGLATDFCVAWTAMDARKLGFETYVIEDATRGIDLNGSLAAAWKQMAAKGVKRIQSGAIETA
jgi:nicotinamidase/pyrazinamidase